MKSPTTSENKSPMIVSATEKDDTLSRKLDLKISLNVMGKSSLTHIRGTPRIWKMR